MDPIAATFLATLVGAFLGVAGPLALRARSEKAAYNRALDIAFVQCEGYARSVKAYGNYLLEALGAEPRTFRKQAPALIAKNLEEPQAVASFLATGYAKFIRPSDLFLLLQSEHNLRNLFRNLTASGEADLGALDKALGAQREEACRRAWLVFNTSQRGSLPFSLGAYNTLVLALNETKEKRLSSLSRAQVRIVQRAAAKQISGTPNGGTI